MPPVRHRVGHPALPVPLLLAPLLLVACGGAGSGKPAGGQTPGGGARLGDPAVAAAIAAPIMADPGLAQMANADTIRPPTMPDPVSMPADTLGLPAAMSDAGLSATPSPAGDCAGCRAARGALTLGALAEHLSGSGAACAASIGYSGGWALSLPSGIRLPPDARITEGAGSDAAGCRLRAVSLVSPSPTGRVLDWLHTRARESGFATEHRADDQGHLLTGNRPGASFAAYVTAADNDLTEVRLVASGR